MTNTALPPTVAVRTSARRIGRSLAIAAVGIGATLAIGAPPATAGTDTATGPGVAIPSGDPFYPGPGSPYPSTVTFSDSGDTIESVRVTLSYVVHSSASDLNIVMQAPDGRTVVLMADCRGFDPVDGTLTFADGGTELAPGQLGVPVGTGTYAPSTCDAPENSAPAPQCPCGATLASLAGGNPNGTWSLWVYDGAYEDGGRLGGWTVAVDSTDVRGPQATPTASPARNAAGWNDSPVTVVWNWTDDGVGIDPARCTTQSTSRGEGSITMTATCADRAGHTATARHVVRVDTTYPSAVITSPQSRTYLQRAVVNARFRCTDSGSGVSRCTATSPDGAPLDTATPGRHTFTVTVTDRAGNRTNTITTYTVVSPPTCNGWKATILGTPGGDLLTGTPGRDVIVSGGGIDRIDAGGGNDLICAGSGNDTINSGAGSDTVHGQSGNDQLVGGGGRDNLDGGAGVDALHGQAGDDRLRGSTGRDSCAGGAGTDTATTCERTLGIP
jgi:subtilisin-like proprotein convertase family protein